MRYEDYLLMFSGLMLGQIPVLAATLYGLWTARRWKHTLPAVSRRASWGFGLLLFQNVTGMLIQIVITVMRTNAMMAGSSETWFKFLSLLGLITYPLFVAGILILASAVFMERQPLPVAAPASGKAFPGS